MMRNDKTMAWPFLGLFLLLPACGDDGGGGSGGGGGTDDGAGTGGENGDGADDESGDPRMDSMRARGKMMRALSLSLALGAIPMAATGCSPESSGMDDGVVETAHLRITNSTGNPICAGTSALLEGEVVRIAAALELPLWAEDDELEVRFGEDVVEEVCSEIDLEHINGCVSRVDGDLVVAATELAYTGPHELVHAVRRSNLALGHPMFEEGLAEILSGSDGFPVYAPYPHGEPTMGPVELLEVQRSEFEPGFYVPSQSFVSWLWETHGRPTLMSFMNDPAFSDGDAMLPLFEEYFGQTLAEAEQAWRFDDRPDPVWGAPCIPERTYSLADGPVEISGDLDCREPTVYGASYFMSVWPMCLDVPENTRVRISFEADHGRVSVQLIDPCDAGPAGAEAYRSKYLDAGAVLEEDIAGCRHRLTLGSQEPGFPATPYSIRIEEISG